MNAPAPLNAFSNAAPVGATPVTVAFGDGIGPEIMAATLKVLTCAGAHIAIEPICVGEAQYLAGHTSGIAQEAWDSLRRTKVFLKGPISTPQGGGYKSLNVTIRKSLGLYANVRPCVALAPYAPTFHPKMDVVIIRENEEDLYAGIEHRQTDDVYQCLKLVTRPGCEKIIRYAFEYALANGRKTITCFSKDNIMKLTDGLFHKVFDEIGKDYPQIAKKHMIVDIGAARLAAKPEQFDVIVTLNLYGDIISDIAAEVAGSVGLAGSSNIGDHGAMFEAIHGSAPDIAGQNIANPSGLIQSAVMMLNHIGQHDVAARIHNALMKTIEDGVHTADIYSGGFSTQRAGTMEFADAVIARLGQTPSTLPVANFAPRQPASIPSAASTPKAKTPAAKTLVGVDVFVHWSGQNPDQLAAALEAGSSIAELKMITNRGVKVWPQGLPETFKTDHWRCRFMALNGGAMEKAAIPALLARLLEAGVDVIKTETLCEFDGAPGYSLGQGQ